MWYVTQSLGVVNNVLKLHNLLLYMDRKTKYFNRWAQPCSYHYFLTLLIRYISQNTTGEVMWSYNVTTIEHEREKCESSVFRKERLVYPLSITLLR